MARGSSSRGHGFGQSCEISRSIPEWTPPRNFNAGVLSGGAENDDGGELFSGYSLVSTTNIPLA